MKKVVNSKSFKSYIINLLFSIRGVKKYTSTVKGNIRFIKKLKKLQSNYHLLEDMGFSKIGTHNVYEFGGNSNRVLVYYHGGNYIEQANKYQIEFAKQIALKTNSKLIVPVYKLVPYGTFEDAEKEFFEIYDELKLNYFEEINFLGDSAGGGLALALAMELRDRKYKGPKNIILMSPWIDIKLDNPDVIKDAKMDKMCGIEGTKYDGILWAGNISLNDFRVSPIYGDFTFLGKMTIIFGGREVLTSECKRFSKMLTDQNIEHNYIEYTRQGHDFGAYPTKEGRAVIEDIVSIIKGE